MADVLPIIVPRETVNDDEVTIVRWLQRSGQWVHKGATLVEIETTKAVLTLQAEQSGHLEIIENERGTVRVGQTIGQLHQQAVATAAAPSPGPDAQPAAENVPAEVAAENRISGKAMRLIELNRLSVELFRHLPFVRESDVLELINKSSSSQQPKEQLSLNGEAAVAKPATKPRGIWAETRAAAKDRGWSVPRLMFNYVFRNYLLNILIPFAPVGLIILIHRLRGVKIGQGCFIDPNAQVETAYPQNITIGDDVRIAAHSVIMTHIKAPHHLRETGIMPFSVNSVILEDHCFIGVNSVIMPGVRIGKGAIVASGAVVMNDVPAYTMVAGNPAKPVKRF